MTLSPVPPSSDSSSTFNKLNMHVGLIITKENQLRELTFKELMGVSVSLKTYPVLENIIEYYLNQAFAKVTLVTKEEIASTDNPFDAFITYSAGFKQKEIYALGVYMQFFDKNKMPIADVFETENVQKKNAFGKMPSALLFAYTLGFASDPYSKKIAENMQEVIKETVKNDVEFLNKDPRVEIYAQSLSPKKTGTAFIKKEEGKIISNERKEKAQSSEALETLIQTNPQSFVKRSIFGVYVIENANKEIEIYMVSKQSSAFEADLHIGDIIIGVDDIEIKNRSQLFELIYERKNPGDAVDLLIKRKGRLIKKSITPETSYISKDMYALLYEITKNIDPVNLAIVSGSLNNIYLQGEALEQWQATMKSYLITTMENYYLTFLKPERNFSLIDRTKVSNILNELEMQYSGLVDVNSQQELGRMLGASHLLVIDYSRSYVSNTEALDVELHKLIEIKTGKVLASVPFKIKVNAK